MSEGKLKTARRGEISGRVRLSAQCGEHAITIGGQVLAPDKTRAYVEFYLSHGFPVVTTDSTAIHPQVVANSYGSMLHKVFDLAHLMRSYDPKKNPRDRILGTVVAVELTAKNAENAKKFQVQSDRSQALGIRAVAVVHRQAEQAERILDSYFSGEQTWTVSMEQDYYVENSGFAIAGNRGVEGFVESTPEDLRMLGWTYVRCVEAPEDLLECFEPEESRMTRLYRQQQTVVLFGGLDGTVHYKGVGLTPLGKEKEARVAQMLASHVGLVGVDGEVMFDLAGPLRKTLGVLKE